MCLYSWDYKINYNENEDKNEKKITDTTKIRCLYKKACSTERFKFRLNNYKSAHLTFTKKKSVKQFLKMEDIMLGVIGTFPLLMKQKHVVSNKWILE